MIFLRHFSQQILSCSLIVLVSQVVYAASSLRGFPVNLDGVFETGGPLAFDIDGDGRLEILLAANNALHALEADGHPVAGFPYALKKGDRITTPLSAGRLGGVLAVFFGTDNQGLVAVGSDGKAINGFFYRPKGELSGAPSLIDVDDDKVLDVVFATKNGKIHAINSSGQSLSGYPIGRGSIQVSTAVTVGRFRPTGPKVFLFGDKKGLLHAWRQDGSELSGFPFKAKFSISSQPVLGDIDDDGSFEVVFNSKDFSIYAVNDDGSIVDRFPVSTNYRIYSTSALADIDGDGVCDIVVASSDGKLYVIGKGAKILKGFPVNIGRRVHSSPVIGDIDHDGRLEIAIGSDKRKVLLFRHDGRRYPGFPVNTDDPVVVSALMADLNADGLVEIAAVSSGGQLSVFRMIKKGDEDQGLVWPVESRDNARSGYTYPNEPRYVDLKLSPENPFTTDSLEIGYRFFDMDGESESQTIIKWFRNGKHASDFDGLKKLPATATRKHERWLYTLQAGKKGRIFASPSAKINNTPPGPPQVTILPDPARTMDDIEMKIVQESQDVDGDRIRYSITWIKDRMPMKNMRRSKIRAKYTLYAQRWTVVVTPSDGEVNGAPAKASLVISNTKPAAAKVKFDHISPRVTQALAVVVAKAAFDPDGDQIDYRYLWKANGNILNLPENASSMPAGFVPKHGKVEVEVTSFDGKELGEKTSIATEFVNTPPLAPKIKIIPANPKTGDTVCANIVTSSEDPDRDSIGYEISWTRKGRRYSGPHLHDFCLPASETRKEEQWSAVVLPRDDETKGKAAMASVVIGNTAPGAPIIKVVDPRPKTTEPLKLEVTKPAVDPDGDSVWLDIAWFEVVEDKKTSNRKTKKARRKKKQYQLKELVRGKNLFSLDPQKTRKNTKYVAKVLPQDGKDQGREILHWFDVQNSAPTKCQVKIEPALPKAGDSLQAVIEKPSRDVDQDKIKMRYRWYLEGKPQQPGKPATLIDGKNVVRGQHWKVVATPFDGNTTGEQCESSVTVVNSVPSAPVVEIVPKSPKTEDDLLLRIRRPAKDPDGDHVRYKIFWSRNKKLVKESADKMRVASGYTKKNDLWIVDVIPQDGHADGATATVKVTIVNTPPNPAVVKADKWNPKTTSDLVVKIDKAAFDVDQDRVSTEVVWYSVNKKNAKQRSEIAKGKDLLRLPADKTDKYHRYLAELTPSDGVAKGKPAYQWFEVQNTAPSKCEIKIDPAKPMTGQRLKVKIIKPSTDSDNDKIKMRYRWYKDNEAMSLSDTENTMKGRHVVRGQRWRVVATPFDGETEGMACAASVEAINQAPVAPRIMLNPKKPDALSSLSVNIVEPAKDPDGDQVKLKISWTLDGKSYPAGDGSRTIPAGSLKKGQRWKVMVVASDGELDSKPVFAESEVFNLPPKAPQIKIWPKQPLSSNDLSCRLMVSTQDPDTDSVEHFYEWYLKKGKKIKGPAVHKGEVLPASKTRKGQIWTCKAWASDGVSDGGQTLASVVVNNAPPTAGKIEIKPANPTMSQSLHCVIVDKSTDPDNDKIQYRFQWTKDGVVQSFAAGTNKVPARLTKDKDIWQCTVIANDGKLDGPKVASPEVVVRIR
jgi:hypothetical protein